MARAVTVDMVRVLLRRSLRGSYSLRGISIDWPNVHTLLRMHATGPAHNVVEMVLPRVMAETAQKAEYDACRVLPKRVASVKIPPANGESKQELWLRNRQLFQDAIRRRSPYVTSYVSDDDWAGSR